ncbi:MULTISPECIES: hypothetical protein [Bacillus cereus group]|uniref:hypothetical protein n=1 Tax=Bacillus cereus group TaxID=86661 RepID=UPI0011A68AF5|nr:MULTISPECIES: hypothetical protein [Bacillus cereus group]
MGKKGEVGRPRQYDNPETRKRFKQLVYEKRLEKTSGILTISDMVRISKRFHEEKPDEYPIAYNKDAWGTWGKQYLDEANNISKITVEVGSDRGEIEIPNFSELIERHYSDKYKLLELLIPQESLFHELADENIGMVQENERLKSRVAELEEELKKFEGLILEMAHHSAIKHYKDKHGLKPVLEMAQNRDSLGNLDNLEEFLQPTKSEEPEIEIKVSGNEENNVLLANWKQKRKK